MFKVITNFFQIRRGNLVENIIYIIVIGAMTFTFYSANVKAPMEQNMDALNDQIETWTNPTP